MVLFQSKIYSKMKKFKPGDYEFDAPQKLIDLIKNYISKLES